MFSTPVLAVMLLVAAFLNTVLNQYYVSKVGIPQWQFLTWNTVCSTTIFITLMLCARWPLIWRGRKDIPWRRLAKIVLPSSISLGCIIPGSTILYSMPNLPSAIAMIPLKGSSILAAMVNDLIRKVRTSWKLKVGALFSFASLSTAILWPPNGGFKFLESGLALGVVIICGFIAYPYRVWAIREFKATMQSLTPERKLTAAEQTENDKVLAFFDQLGAYLFILIAIAATYLAAYILGPAHTPVQIKHIHIALANFNFKIGLISGGIYALYAFCTIFILMDPSNATFATTTNKITVVIASIIATVYCYQAGFPSSRQLGKSEWVAIGLVALATAFVAMDYRKNGAVSSVPSPTPSSTPGRPSVLAWS